MLKNFHVSVLCDGSFIFNGTVQDFLKNNRDQELEDDFLLFVELLNFTPNVKFNMKSSIWEITKVV